MSIRIPMKKVFGLSSIVAALLAAPLFSSPASADPAAVVGQAAPDFTLTDENGTSHTLSQYRGKTVILEWTNPQCPFIVRHYNANTIESLASQWGDDVVLMSVNSSHFNTPADTIAWRDAEGFSYPTLQDPSGDVGRMYGAQTTPHMYVIDTEGVLAYAGGIDDDPRGRSETPTNHVVAAVEALRSGARPDPSTTEPYGCTVKYE